MGRPPDRGEDLPVGEHRGHGCGPAAAAKRMFDVWSVPGSAPVQCHFVQRSGSMVSAAGGRTAFLHCPGADGGASAVRMRASNSPSAKGFLHVIIGASIQSLDFFGLAVAGGQDDDGNGGELTQFCQYQSGRPYPGRPRSSRIASGARAAARRRASSPRSARSGR